MSFHMVLASGSEIRAHLLRQAGLDINIIEPRVDERTIKEALLAEKTAPRDIADCLAEAKARKVSNSQPTYLVLGCDQVLEFEGRLVSKPTDAKACAAGLREMSGKKHKLYSAAVVYLDGKPIWRHVGVVNMRMRNLSDAFIGAYVTRNWDSIRHSVGGYKLEEEGVRLFSAVQGDFFNVMGLPLLELLGYLTDRGELEI